MGLADAAIRSIVDSVAFRASASPYLLLDSELRIRAANLAYQRVTLHESSDLLGELMFTAFPDNPALPEVRSVERLGASFDRAFTTGRPDRMDLQRYDVRDPRTGQFAAKSWLPSNSPVLDAEGRPVGVLHHVEDVTHLLVATALERHLVAPAGSGVPSLPAGTEAMVDALARDSLERRVRARMLTDQSRRVLERMSRRIDADGPPAGPQ